MKLLAFAASSSSKSINQKLVSYAASLVVDAKVELLDINDYEMPLYSEDREAELGELPQARAFYEKLGQADAVMISFAEHNGHYTAAYKNLFDWTSRIDMKVYQGKPMVIMATSPGPGGASSVLAAAKASAPFFAADIRAAISVPNFYDCYDEATGALQDAALIDQLQTAAVQLLK
ncbi:NAD(P)H-dependent FMN reductase [Sinobacterium caligoides]|uniref:NAD(P)H-dependent FMN reductase n=1 Tax=Sinobacterium caligoides TaxID=933926 RepID=A0A3N2DER8_9GAMM|nr:NAD(P)H-dependent oxidoreductase [Sinobacterium caligoides]ROR97914.1 NAD(P)H-dependent FMN reductase [Sinobacterium caligoides]